MLSNKLKFKTNIYELITRLKPKCYNNRIGFIGDILDASNFIDYLYKLSHF